MSPQKPSIWIKHQLLTSNPDQEKIASFVEYLRWMRKYSDNKTIDSGTKIALFKEFENNDFSDALNRLTNRTEKLADESFKVTCSWRIRVGGSKGVESMLLPAFDNLGMPYIPSSTLRGIAREMAEQDEKTKDSDIKEIFGDINSQPTKMGKVVFLDAYPLPYVNEKKKNKLGGISPDMANAIWAWNGDLTPEYSNPNPNSFLSLKNSTFVIGLKRTSKCSNKTFTKVRNWLIKGLAQGIGSRVNSGYGALEVEEKLQQHIVRQPIILKVDFELQGQLIHGRETFQEWEIRRNKKTGKEKLQLNTSSIEEIRPVAFRSTLRYWFRVLALGILSNTKVHTLELEIFGGIEPEQHTGLFRCETINAEISNREVTSYNPPSMSGTLILRNNSLVQKIPEDKQEAVESLLKELTWLMFHLGGVGQGARRSCYCRGEYYDKNGRRRKKNPFWRGSSLIPDTDSFWDLKDNILDLKTLFQERLQSFYSYLATVASLNINDLNLRSVEFSRNRSWAEAVDSNCEILICQGNAEGNKNFALSILHSQKFKVPDVCGRVNPSIPSPVWIRHIEYLDEIDFQVVTVFGAKTRKRKDFVKELRENANRCLQVFPIKSNIDRN